MTGRAMGKGVISVLVFLSLVGVACGADGGPTVPGGQAGVDGTTKEVGTLENPVPVGGVSTGPIWDVRVLEASSGVWSRDERAIRILLEVTNISDEIQEVGVGGYGFSVRLAVDGQVRSAFTTFQWDGNDPLKCGFDTDLLPGASIRYVECVDVTGLGATNANTPAVLVKQNPSIWDEDNSSTWHEMPQF